MLMNRIQHLFRVARLGLTKDEGEIQFVQIKEGNTGSDGAEAVTDRVPFVGLFGLAALNGATARATTSMLVWLATAENMI